MFKKSILMQSMLVALIAPSAVMAEVEATVELRNETAIYSKDGQTIGQATSQLDSTTDNNAGDLMKFQNQAKVFLNGDIGEDSSWHAELQLIYDSEAIDDESNGGVNYKGHKKNTQNDYFRELYVDTEAMGWSWRLGKQQVVWGTADGIKLLDIINPTDFREVNQNVMEDARIPIWMINGETEIGDNGNLQVIVSEVQKNRIPGLNVGGDQGQPFVMKGTDTITGKVGGFYNIAPNLGKVSNSFHNFAEYGAFTGGAANPAGLAPFVNLSVDGFAGQDWTVAFAVSGVAGVGVIPTLTGTNTPGNAVDTIVAPLVTAPGTYSGNGLLDAFANDPLTVGPNSNSYVTNLTNVQASGGVASTVTWNPSAPVATFDHMPNATFATFNTFAGNNTTAPAVLGTIPALTTSYRVEDRDDEANAGFRYKDSTQGGLNYSFNYFYHYESNPFIELSYHDASSGTKLETEIRDGTGSVVSRANVNGNWNNVDPTTWNTVYLKNGTTYYGANDPGLGAFANSGVDLRFTEKQNRIHSLGGALDFAIDQYSVPLVVRAEFLYDKDSMAPVVDKRLLAIGDLEGALVPVEQDMFKYVLGLDATVMTNLLISGQFIQFYNVDYVDEARTCTTQFGASFDCSRYTADPSTMSTGNSLQKGWETKEFVSVFLSKPIGEDQLGRWNNITIWEEGNGWWNRLDAEYSVTDQFIVSGEWNQYWGDENTTFGQLEHSSNVQIGLRYIFEE